ncbi:MAG: addiction module protein [Pseudomonadota bacterium]
MNNFDFSNLSVGERIDLAQTLLDSVQGEISEPKISEAWQQEIEKRASEIASGAVKTVPWEDVKKELFSGL